MKLSSLIFVATSMALAGCATQTRAPVQVTRFHLGQPIAPGQVAIEPLNPAAAGSIEFTSYAQAVGAELTRLGFTLAPGVARSEIVAVVDVTRGSRETVGERSPFSVGIGGGGFSGGRGGGVGIGGGVSFPIGKSRGRETVLTQLSVQLKRRSEGTVIWEGRARSQQVGAAGAEDPAATVRTLATALFASFPGESGRTILVK